MEKVFITKYALTKGILEKEAEICDLWKWTYKSIRERRVFELFFRQGMF